MDDLFFVYFIFNIFIFVFGPIFAIIFVLIDFLRLNKPKGRGVIIAEYKPPDDITPIQAAIILGKIRPGMKLVSEIFYLIEQGFIKIEKVANDYYLSPIETFKKPKYGYQSYLVDYVFKESEMVKVSDLRFLSSQSATAEISFTLNNSNTYDTPNGFVQAKEYFKRGYHNYDNMNGFFKIDAWARKILIDTGYKDSGLTSTKSKFTVFGLVLIIIQFLFGFLVHGIFVPGLILFIYGGIRPNLTQKGILMREYLLGYKEYLSKAEINNLKETSSPNSDLLNISSHLPYAIAFQLHHEWMSEFSKLFKSDEDPNKPKINSIFGHQ